jgi:protein-disulfide isomerase
MPNVLQGRFPLPETNKNPGGGAKRAWPLLFWLPLITAVVAASFLSSCAAQSSQLSGQEPQAGQGEQTSNQTAKPAGDREDAPQRDAELGHPVLGDADAPVLMVEYGDFQ